MNSSVYIRADGNVMIGSGHLVRCIALAQMIKEFYTITFVCKEIPSNLIEALSENQFYLIMVTKESEFLELLTSLDTVVLDGYSFDTDFQKKIKKIGCSLVCVDDLFDQEFFADLIINQAPGVDPNKYKAQPYTQFALGLNYVLLRDSFLKSVLEEKRIDKTESVFICFGGSDQRNLTQMVLSVVISFREFKKIVVVTGFSYKFSEKLESLIDADHRVFHFHGINENQMTQLMWESDIAIIPASGILFEAIASGCKIIFGKYIDNQRVLYEKFKSLNFFESVENFEVENIMHSVSNIIKNKGGNPRLIDGRSAERILEKFNALATSHFEVELYYRFANLDDLHLYYKWANDKLVRENSFHSEPVIFEQHVNWFYSKVNSENCFLYLFINNAHIPVGQVRIEIVDKEAVIGISIDKKFRGKSLGTKMLLQSSNDFFNKKSFRKIIAYVKKENVASYLIFKNAGFINEGNIQVQNNMCFKLTKYSDLMKR